MTKIAATIWKKLRRLRPGLLVLCLVLSVPGYGDLSAQTQKDAAGLPIQKIEIGVLATEGATRALEAWTPTITLLNAAAQEQEQPYRFGLQPQTPSSLLQSLAGDKIGLILTDPASFVTAEVENRARAILSVAHMWQDRTYDLTGALVFAKADSDLQRFADLEGKRIMAVAPNDFAGWWLAEQEFRKHRLEPRDMFGSLVFSDGNEREVVYAVQAGLVDAGVVRAGVLEGLIAKGVIDAQTFRPISVMPHSGFPFMVSTPLYPEWVLSALPDVPEEALSLIINTLLTVKPESEVSRAAGDAVWQAPQNYQSVHDLLISLRVRPYENYLLQAATRIYNTYRWPILGLIALIAGSLLFLLYQLRRNAQFVEAQRNVLESEVRSKLFYRSAVEEHTVFCMLTRDGIISHVNERFLDTSDRTRQSLIDRPLTHLLTDADQMLMIEDIMNSMRLGVTWAGALKLARPVGPPAWVQCTFIPVTSSSKELSEVAIVATDVTKTRQGVSEDSFNDTLELIQDQVVVLRPGRLEIVYCNTAAEELLVRGKISGTWKGKLAADLITKDDLNTLRMRCEALVEGPQRRVTWETTTKNGVTYEISLEYAQPEQDEPRFIAIYRDITERKAAEKAKNEFVATVSHELRTPLTSMKGALGLVLSGALGEMPEKMHKLVTMAGSNCDRLVMLINDILDLEKIEAGKMDFKMEVFDLRELVTAAEEANQFYAKNFGVSFRASFDDTHTEFMTLGDRGRLRQVLDNLMSNAAKFSPKGSEAIVSLSHYKDRLRISIRDYGSGIPVAAQPKIFDKFTQADSSDTRSKGGTGLGLSIAKLIVENHHGRIFFVSEEGVGTEFFIDLPRAEGDEQVPFSLNEPPMTRFSDAPIEDETEDDVKKPAAFDPQTSLLELARRGGAEVNSEYGRVNATQVIKARGVVGQSTVLNWMSSASRGLMGELIGRDLMQNREVLLVEMTVPRQGNDRTTDPVKASAMLMQNWLMELAQTDKAFDGEINGVSIVIQPEVRAWAARNGYLPVADPSQVVSLLETDSYDVVAQFDRIGDAGVATIFPLSTSKLYPSLPVTIVVTRREAVKTERGVVSKFAGAGGGGRGAARQRNG